MIDGDWASAAASQGDAAAAAAEREETRSSRASHCKPVLKPKTVKLGKCGH